jgi:acyl-CoA thioester hydrolase
MIEAAKIHVRFSDLDLLGHVNNAVYLSYFEIARVHYFKEILGLDWDWRTHTVLLVKNEVEYIKPILLHDDVRISLFTTSIGNKSFTLRYEVMVDNELRAKGSSVLVSFNAVEQQTILIPEAMKIALDKIKE